MLLSTLALVKTSTGFRNQYPRYLFKFQGSNYCPKIQGNWIIEMRAAIGIYAAQAGGRGLARSKPRTGYTVFTSYMSMFTTRRIHIPTFWSCSLFLSYVLKRYGID